MKILISVIFFCTSLLLYSQDSLLIFNGNFDSCLIEASIQDKDVFFITRSQSCPVFDKFKAHIEADSNTINFLNNEFIVYEWDMDHTNKTEYKRLKKYYHSWRSFPQLYFLTDEEKLIVDFVYSAKVKHEDQLKVWKDNQNAKENWRKLKKLSKKESLSYQKLWEYIIYRDMIYSSFSDIQINKRVSWYFAGIDSLDYSLKKHWILFKRHINLRDLGTNPELFDYVARNKEAFQKENGKKEVEDYLYNIYYANLQGRKEKEIDKIANKYPYNTINEAQRAIEAYRRNKYSQNLFNESW